LIFLLVLCFSCEEPPPPIVDNIRDTLPDPDNPDDTARTVTPALVFSPGEADGQFGNDLDIDAVILGIHDLSGLHIVMTYNADLIEVRGIAAGTAFSGTSSSMFMYNSDTAGVIHVFSSYLPDTMVFSVSGSESITTLTLRPVGAGDAVLSYDETLCRLVDPENMELEILRFEEGVIHVQ